MESIVGIEGSEAVMICAPEYRFTQILSRFTSAPQALFLPGAPLDGAISGPTPPLTSSSVGVYPSLNPLRALPLLDTPNSLFLPPEAAEDALDALLLPVGVNPVGWREGVGFRV